MPTLMKAMACTGARVQCAKENGDLDEGKGREGDGEKGDGKKENGKNTVRVWKKISMRSNSESSSKRVVVVWGRRWWMKRKAIEWGRGKNVGEPWERF